MRRSWDNWNPARMRTLVQLQRNYATQDGMGGETQAWLTYATVHCEENELTGRQLMEAQAVQAETTHQLKMRYLKGVLAKDRALLPSGVALDINAAINPDYRGRWLLLLCKEARS